MDALKEPTLWVCGAAIVALTVWVSVLRDEIRSLRKSRHEHGNWIESLRADVTNLKHDVERLRDGRNGRR